MPSLNPTQDYVYKMLQQFIMISMIKILCTWFLLYQFHSCINFIRYVLTCLILMIAYWNSMNACIYYLQIKQPFCWDNDIINILFSLHNHCFFFIWVLNDSEQKICLATWDSYCQMISLWIKENLKNQAKILFLPCV